MFLNGKLEFTNIDKLSRGKQQIIKADYTNKNKNTPTSIVFLSIFVNAI
jgi:hypothetical protein